MVAGLVWPGPLASPATLGAAARAVLKGPGRGEAGVGMHFSKMHFSKILQILAGSFSAVSKRNFARK